MWVKVLARGRVGVTYAKATGTCSNMGCGMRTVIYK